jgi:septal ring factor EnvC (AmiA/AmiB activator)
MGKINMIENEEKELIRLRTIREFLMAGYAELYGLYVQRVGMLAEKNAELTESYEELARQQKTWEVQDQEYNDRINKMSAEQLEMAIKIKHLDRELNLHEKGKKKLPRKKKEVDE